MRENPEARAAGSVAARSFTIVSGAVADSDEALAEMRSQNSSTVTGRRSRGRGGHRRWCRRCSRPESEDGKVHGLLPVLDLEVRELRLRVEAEAGEALHRVTSCTGTPASTPPRPDETAGVGG